MGTEQDQRTRTDKLYFKYLGKPILKESKQGLSYVLCRLNLKRSCRCGIWENSRSVGGSLVSYFLGSSSGSLFS